MKYYDKMGETHDTAIGAMGTDVINRFRKTKIGSKIDTTVRKAEARIENMMDKQDPLSDAEIEAIVNGIMLTMKDPIRDLRDDKLNSELGSRVFIRTLINSILYNSINVSLDDANSISDLLALKLINEISITAVSKPEQG